MYKILFLKVGNGNMAFIVLHISGIFHKIEAQDVYIL